MISPLDYLRRVRARYIVTETGELIPVGPGPGIAIGEGAEASGDGAVAIGPNSIATGVDAVAIGVNYATAGALADWAWALGSWGSASDIIAAVFGGNIGWATGQVATVLGGDEGWADADLSTVLGGNDGRTKRPCEAVVSAGSLVNPGDAQVAFVPLGKTVTGSGGNIVMPLFDFDFNQIPYIAVLANEHFVFDGHLTGKDTVTKNVNAYKLEGFIANNAGTTTLKASTVTAIYEDVTSPTMTPTLAADDTNDGLAITLIDHGTNTWKWSGHLRLTEGGG